MLDSAHPGLEIRAFDKALGIHVYRKLACWVCICGVKNVDSTVQDDCIANS